ncbi:hypothetical protein CBL_03556 [Carabus blaptoides fortunei]
MENSCKWHRPAIVVSIVLFAIVSCVFYNSQETVNNPQRVADGSRNVIDSHQNTTSQMIEKKTQVKKFVIHKATFPHCVREHIYTVLAGILQEIHFKHTMCTDSYCHTHNLNDNTDVTDDEDGKESSGMFVVYMVISLLLVSLIAAFLEVYKARKTPGRSRDKPELSRRCSLADLTVLRHNRRESMMRRDSVLHMSFDSATSNHRMPLKLLGSSHSDSRRGSLPVVQAKINKWQRSLSADKADETSNDTHHRVHHMIRHH